MDMFDKIDDIGELKKIQVKIKKRIRELESIKMIDDLKKRVLSYIEEEYISDDSYLVDNGLLDMMPYDVVNIINKYVVIVNDSKVNNMIRLISGIEGLEVDDSERDIKKYIFRFREDFVLEYWKCKGEDYETISLGYCIGDNKLDVDLDNCFSMDLFGIEDLVKVMNVDGEYHSGDIESIFEYIMFDVIGFVC
jgi:hypothetical protein